VQADEVVAPRRRQWRRLAAPIVIGIVAIAWASFLWSQIDLLRAYVWRITPAALLVSVALGALYYAGLAGCWSLLLRRMSAGAPPHLAAMRIWLLSMVSRYVPGNIWHILSRTLMAQQLGVSRTTVVASASIEQIITLLAAFLLAALTLPSRQIRTAVAAEIPIVEIVAGLLIAGMLFLHPRVLGALLAYGARRFNRPELAWSYRYRDVLIVTAASILAHCCSGLSLAAVLAGITDISMKDLLPMIGAAALAWALGYLSILTPSGLGVREGVLVGLLLLIVPLPVATVASLLFRIATTLGELLAVLVFWALGRSGSYPNRA
jgi:hypothetical protein